MNSLGFLETLWQDTRYALRSMRKNPALAAIAVLTLALGIGGNTAMFTVIRAVLLKPLGYADPDRLVLVGVATPVRYGIVRPAVQSFIEFGAFGLLPETMNLTGAEEPEALKGARVSANFLRILGVEPALGRSFLPEEDKPGGPPVALISNALWLRRFGGDAKVTGATATFNSTPYTIAGVLPAAFQFPFEGVDVWITKPAELRATSHVLTGFARLKPGISLEQANAELEVLSRQYSLAHPEMIDSKPRAHMRAERLKDQLVKNVRALLWMLFGAVGFVLLIACANVAGLLLARATSRSREFAVRSAIGAGRGRLIRQLLAESVLLSLGGGALGLLLAEWSLKAISIVTALGLPRVREIRLDGAVLAFAAALSIATGILFGLVPSLGASRPDVSRLLRGGDASAARRTFGLSARQLLVVGQVALSIVLLIGAALLMQSMARLHGVSPGFQPADLLTMQIALPAARYDAVQKKVFFEELLRRVEATPGVRSATMSLTIPMLGGWPGSPVEMVELPPVKFTDRPIAKQQIVTPDFFRTMEIPLRRGREFTSRDRPGAPRVAIVNETFARHFRPDGQDPLGRHILVGIDPQPVEIVGIVADVNEYDVGERLEVYRPCAQTAWPAGILVVRTIGDPLRLAGAIRGQVRAIDPDLPVTGVRTMEEVVEESVGQRRLTMLLLEVFAGVALLLAVVGIYGVIAYSVAQRTEELGIRRALGAQHGHILRLVIGQGLVLTIAGVVLGIAGASALTRVMKSLLFQVSATDPATFLGAALLFVGVALLASYIPARRATSIDPMAALRG